MAEILTRDQQELENTWDVQKLYPSDAAWEEDLAKFKEEMPKVATFEGTLGESAAHLADVFGEITGLERRLEKLYLYASMRSDEDTANAHFQDLEMRVNSVYVEYVSLASFVEPEILEVGEEKVRAWLDDDANKELQAYRRPLELILRKAAHTLSKEEEAIVANTAEIRQTAATAYSLLTDADMRFEPVVHNGETIEITHANFVPLQMSPDRDLRKKVYENFYQNYQFHENTIASLFQSNLKSAKFVSTTRKFPTTRAMYLFENEIDEQIYDNLLDTVHEHLPAMHRYVGLRKKLLGVDELHFYDVYASLVKDYDKKYTFAEAKELVLAALAPLGDEYCSVVESAFTDRWMDIYPNRGKRSGAYSTGSYDSYPYMLLNFTSELDDVFTLIHEMGHSLHSYYSHKNQPYVTADYKIFVAEVASTCNEALLTNYLLKTTTDKEERKYIINHYMESFKSTLYRQTMFAEFEKITHAKVAAGESLTAPVVNGIYKDLNVQYFGPDMVVDDQIALEWARIPHFYRPFYVYQYATGLAAATALSHRILTEGEPAVQDYLKFLSSGSSTDPVSLLKIAGVDMSQKEPVSTALELFNSLIDEMEQLTGV